MMAPTATLLNDGEKLHLQHGPIDLIVSVNLNRQVAFTAAKERFETILDELVSELPSLRKRLSVESDYPKGPIAGKMHNAALPYCQDHYITRMAGVAGAVAEGVMEAMKVTTFFDKAYINNGGDIALHLDGDEKFVTAIMSHDGEELGRISIKPEDDIKGIATSGRHGRSLSLGVADSVTVLAQTAAKADLAATLIANAVDLRDHPLISRAPASSLDPDSDLGERYVVTDCKKLSPKDQIKAINKGEVRATNYLERGLIKGAAIFLQDEFRIIGSNHLTLNERNPHYA